MKPLFSTLIVAASLFIATLPIMGCGEKDTPGHIPDYQQPPGKEDYKYAKAEGNVRIMTYNCFYCKSNTASKTFSDEHTAAFAQVIKALNPDVVVIQELDSGTTERNKRYLLDDIRRATGLDYGLFFGSAAPYSEGKIGPGVLYKRAMQPTSIKKIALPGKETRALMVLTFPRFTLLGTHLDLDVTARKTSAEIVNHELTTLATQPVFFAGDLNDSPSWKPEQTAFPIIERSFEIISARSGSIPDQPNETIDYILVDKAHKGAVKVVQTAVVKQLEINGKVTETQTISDHYPVFVDVRF